MPSKTIINAVLMDARGLQLSCIELCEREAVDIEWLQELLEQGVLNFTENLSPKSILDYDVIRQVQTAKRMKEDLGLNPAGIALVFELLEQLEVHRRELAVLRRHFEG